MSVVQIRPQAPLSPTITQMLAGPTDRALLCARGKVCSFALSQYDEKFIERREKQRAANRRDLYDYRMERENCCAAA